MYLSHKVLGLHVFPQQLQCALVLIPQVSKTLPEVNFNFTLQRTFTWCPTYKFHCVP